MLPARKHTRLTTYDYTSPGEYFVTICTHGRRLVLGDVREGRFVPTRAGSVVEWCWRDIARNSPHVTIDTFQVMPNHLHGILRFGEDAPSSGARPTVSAGSLGAVVRGFKAATTRRLRARGLIGPDDELWQDGFHDHVVRSPAALQRIREYIQANPAMWHEDEENPDCTRVGEFGKWMASQGRHPMSSPRP